MRVRLNMGDVGTEPSMEDILSSIKRIIAEEGESAIQSPRPRRIARPHSEPEPQAEDGDADEILELRDPVSAPAPVKNPKPEAASMPTSKTSADDQILSRRTADASRTALESLSRLKVRPEQPGADTLEGMVREMLRPMLRDWLDAHLPDLVESLVEREIKRIAGEI